MEIFIKNGNGLNDDEVNVEDIQQKIENSIIADFVSAIDRSDSDSHSVLKVLKDKLSSVAGSGDMSVEDIALAIANDVERLELDLTNITQAVEDAVSFFKDPECAKFIVALPKRIRSGQASLSSSTDMARPDRQISDSNQSQISSNSTSMGGFVTAPTSPGPIDGSAKKFCISNSKIFQ